MVKHAETPQVVSLKAIGTGYRAYWTERALVRNGYKISPDATDFVTVDEATDSWLFSKNGKEYVCSSLQELLAQMELN